MKINRSFIYVLLFFSAIAIVAIYGKVKKYGDVQMPDTKEMEDIVRNAEWKNGSFGYGYLFWRGPWDSYRADGKYGQLAIVLKKENAVIAVNAESRDPKMMERCMNVIMPQLV